MKVVSVTPHRRRLRKTGEQPGDARVVHVHKPKPTAGMSNIIAIRYLGLTPNNQAKWSVLLAGGHTRTIWTAVEGWGGMLITSITIFGTFPDMNRIIAASKRPKRPKKRCV